MGISSPGIGSGLDVNSMVSQLMSVESQPLTLLQNKEATYQAQVSALGQVKSALSTFQSAVQGLSDPAQFAAVKATVGDSGVMTASASSSAAPGSYALEVTQLAQSQKLVSAGQASSSATIGAGTITFDFGTVTGGSLDAATGKYTGASFAASGSGSKTVTIDSAHATLSGIRDAINAAGMGVTASIVNDGSAAPNRLVLTNSATGAASSMKISVSGDAALSNLLSQDPASNGGQAMQQTIAAQDAKFSIDGLAVTKPSNHVTDLIEGVTVDLSKTNAGSPTTLTVARDTASATSAVQKFVDAFNAANKTLTDLQSYDASTKTAAALNGDSTVRNIQSRMRNVLSSVVQGGGAYDRLADVGVTFQKDGTLAVDSTKLNSALTSHFNDVASLFAVAGSATDSEVSYSAAGDSTQPGSYPVTVTRLATQAAVTGSSAAGLAITQGVNDGLSVDLNGTMASITIKPGTYASADALALEVQSEINGDSAFSGSAVSVTQNNGVLSMTSSQYGSGSSITLSGTGAQNLLGAGPTASTGLDVAGTIGGVAAAGSGQKLIGASGSAADGLEVTVSGGVTGSRGTVSYAKGYASQFDDLITSFLASDGTLTAHTNGLNSSITSVQKQESDMNTQLATKEAALRAQFTALDAQISSMNSTSSYLTQELAQIQANG